MSRGMEPNKEVFAEKACEINAKAHGGGDQGTGMANPVLDRARRALQADIYNTP